MATSLLATSAQHHFACQDGWEGQGSFRQRL